MSGWAGVDGGEILVGAVTVIWPLIVWFGCAGGAVNGYGLCLDLVVARLVSTAPTVLFSWSRATFMVRSIRLVRLRVNPLPQSLTEGALLSYLPGPGDLSSFPS